MTLSGHVVLAVLAMAAATYATRAGGFWLMRWLPLSPRVGAWLGNIPGAVLVALVVPAAVRGGAAEALAIAATALAMRLTGQDLLAMAVGIAVVVAARLSLPAV